MSQVVSLEPVHLHLNGKKRVDRMPKPAGKPNQAQLSFSDRIPLQSTPWNPVTPN